PEPRLPARVAPFRFGHRGWETETVRPAVPDGPDVIPPHLPSPHPDRARPTVAAKARVEAEGAGEPGRVRPDHRHPAAGQFGDDPVGSDVQILAQHQHGHRTRSLTCPASNPPGLGPGRPWSRWLSARSRAGKAAPPDRRRSPKAGGPRNSGRVATSGGTWAPGRRRLAGRMAGSPLRWREHR